jgi:hypothetical protein
MVFGIPSTAGRMYIALGACLNRIWHSFNCWAYVQRLGAF